MRRVSVAIMLAVTFCCVAVARAENRLSDDDFARMHLLAKPQADEAKWRNVSWLTNLDEARRLAAAQDKPLFIWRSGGGDVLGRT